MRNYFFATKKNTVNVFCDNMASFDKFADLSLIGRPGLSQGGRASYREARPLTARPGLKQGGHASNREAGHLTGRPGLSQNALNLPKIIIKTFILIN